MNPMDLLDLILGSGGVLVVLLVAVYAFFRGSVVPSVVFEEIKKRNSLLEQEAEELSKSIHDLTAQISGLREENASLRTEMKYLRENISRLQDGLK